MILHLTSTIEITSYRDLEEKMKTQQKIFMNRELSWLKFNERVLEEAENREVPYNGWFGQAIDMMVLTTFNSDILLSVFIVCQYYFMTSFDCNSVACMSQKEDKKNYL